MSQTPRRPAPRGGHAAQSPSYATVASRSASDRRAPTAPAVYAAQSQGNSTPQTPSLPSSSPSLSPISAQRPAPTGPSSANGRAYTPYPCSSDSVRSNGPQHVPPQHSQWHNPPFEPQPYPPSHIPHLQHPQTPQYQHQNHGHAAPPRGSGSWVPTGPSRGPPWMRPPPLTRANNQGVFQPIMQPAHQYHHGPNQQAFYPSPPSHYHQNQLLRGQYQHVYAPPQPPAPPTSNIVSAVTPSPYTTDASSLHVRPTSSHTVTISPPLTQQSSQQTHQKQAKPGPTLNPWKGDEDLPHTFLHDSPLGDSSTTQSKDRKVGSTVPAAALDRYAKVFIPQWLRAVNDDSIYSFLQLQEADQLPSIDFEQYGRRVWPEMLWNTVRSGGEVDMIFPERELSSTASAWLPEGGNGAGVTLSEADDMELDVCSSNDTALNHPENPREAVWNASQSQKTRTERSRSPSAALFLGEDGKEATRLSLTGLPVLKPSTYLQRWEPLLQAESETQEGFLSSHAVFAQTLKVYTKTKSLKWDPDGLYRLYLPGVREDRPKLLPGDACQLRPLATDTSGSVGEQLGWLHMVFEARVHAVRAIQGEVIIYCPYLATLSTSFRSIDTAKINVIFLYNRAATQDEIFCVKLLAQKMSESRTPGATILRDWLFPTTRSLPQYPSQLAGATTTIFPKSGSSHSPEKWFDSSLNVEQKASVASILRNEEHRVPFLLSGPRGTGKTLTSVEAILQILHKDAMNRVLVIAPSNAASDVLALRLSSHLSPREMFRLNSPTRTFAEVPDGLNPFTFKDEAKRCFSLPPWQTLMKAKVVVTCCADVPILIKSRVASNIDIGMLQSFFFPGLRKEHQQPIELHWTHLLVDEAAQGTEPDLAPALACVLPHERCRKIPTVILVGDPAQLGPAIKNSGCRSQGLDISLFERLSLLPVYAQSLARLKRHGRSIVLSGSDRGSTLVGGGPSLDIHCGHLVRNYRARHPSLLHLPSTLFYSDSLVPCASASPRLLTLLSNWSQLPNRGVFHGVPMLFADVRTSEEWVDEGVSWWNQGEAMKILQLCQSLLSTLDKDGHTVFRPSDIAVISPFREQVWRIRVLLRKANLGEVKVGPVEAYQGQESPIVILSPVRSRSRFLSRDRETSQGLICETKRLNVALTRARECLIIVGNAEVLGSHCEAWRRVIGHARRNRWIASEGRTVGSGSEVVKATIVPTTDSTPSTHPEHVDPALRDPFRAKKDSLAEHSATDTQEVLDGAQEDISALEAAEASSLDDEDGSGGGGGWWKSMAGDLLSAFSHQRIPNGSTTDPVGLPLGMGNHNHPRPNGERNPAHGLGILAGRMATIALQGDEYDLISNGEEEEADE